MKKKGFAFLLINFVLLSQSVDSLLSEINSQSPREQLEIFIDELWSYRSKNPAYAMQCGQKGAELAKKLGDDSKLAEVNNMLGVIYRNIGNYTKALEYYNSAFEIAKSINDSVQIAYSYNNIGGAYRLERNYTIALTNMFKALEIFEKLDMEEGIAFCTINIGIVYRHQGNYSKALDYINRTIDIRENLGDKYGLAIALNQFVEIYIDKREFDTALDEYAELYKLYEELDDTKGIATALGGMGGILYEKKNYKAAKDYRERSLDLHKSIDNIEGIVNNLNGLALIYLKLNQPDLAQQSLNEAYKICMEPNRTAFLISHYDYRSKYFEELGIMDSALVYYKKYSSLKDSLTALENIASIASMEAIYQVDLAAKENQILLNENKLKTGQTTFLLVLAILLITFLSFIVYRFYRNKELNERLKELNATKDKFFSIVAHDLKNPFNSLLGYSELLASDYENMEETERKQALQDLHNSSKRLLALVDNLLQWSSANIGSLTYNPQTISLKEQLDELIDLYSDSIKQKNLGIELNVDSELTAFIDIDYFKLVMRNLISNAIKFSNSEDKINISASIDDDFILIKVQDFGVGMDTQQFEGLFELGSKKSTKGTQNETGTGLGLILVKDLVTRWGGKIFVESELNRGSTFTITIPKK